MRINQGFLLFPEKEKQKSNHEIQKLRSKVQQMESSSADKSPKTSEKNLVIREKDLMKLKKLEIRLNDINEQIEETNKFNVKEFSFLKDDMRNVRKELSNINFRLNSNEESLRVELDVSFYYLTFKILFIIYFSYRTRTMQLNVYLKTSQIFKTSKKKLKFNIKKTLTTLLASA